MGGMLCDLVAAVPQMDVDRWAEDGERAISYLFGPSVIDEFLAKYGWDMIIRSDRNGGISSGYEWTIAEKVVSLFSSANYSGKWEDYENEAAIMEVRHGLDFEFNVVKGKG